MEERLTNEKGVKPPTEKDTDPASNTDGLLNKKYDTISQKHGLSNQKNNEMATGEKVKQITSRGNTFEDLAACARSECNSSLIMEDEHSSRESDRLPPGNKESPICVDDSLTDDSLEDHPKKDLIPQKQMAPKAKHLDTGQNDSFSFYRVHGDRNGDSEDDEVPSGDVGRHTAGGTASDSDGSDDQDSLPNIAYGKSKDASATTQVLKVTEQGSKNTEKVKSTSVLSAEKDLGRNNDLAGAVNKLQVTRDKGPHLSLKELESEKQNLMSYLEGRKVRVFT